MKFEITEIVGTQTLMGQKIYRYDCFLDNVRLASNVWKYEQEPIKVYEYFIKSFIREWQTKYKRKYDKEFGENQKERYGDV